MDMKATTWTPSNRELVQASRMHGPFYCWHCDRALIHEGEKCHYCGQRDSHRRKSLKKFTVAEE